MQKVTQQQVDVFWASGGKFQQESQDLHPHTGILFQIPATKSSHTHQSKIGSLTTCTYTYKPDYSDDLWVKAQFYSPKVRGDNLGLGLEKMLSQIEFELCS